MGLLTTIKQFLPPSSRSFHELYRKSIETSWVIEGIDERLEQMEKANRERVARLERHLAEADRQHAAHDVHMKLLAWSLYRREGEGYDEAKVRFFRELPRATGAHRLLQLGCAKLLAEFDQICSEHNLTYWAVWGTLLGAVRHEGFIPWDDDVDVGMAREDIRTLMDIVAASKKHVITVVYDPKAMCRQIRFRYRDETIPCFLDIFIYDYSALDDMTLFEQNHAALRAELKETAKTGETAQWALERADVPENLPETQPIKDLFDTAVAEQAKRSLTLPGAVGAKSIIWSVDNIDRGLPGHWRLVKLEEYFPTRFLPFEDGRIAVPMMAEAVLTKSFGDYLSLPDDINGNANQHHKPGMLDSVETAQALESLVEEG